jgi:hypothetical protein
MTEKRNAGTNKPGMCVVGWLQSFDQDLDRGVFRFRLYPPEKWRE